MLGVSVFAYIRATSLQTSFGECSELVQNLANDLRAICDYARHPTTSLTTVTHNYQCLRTGGCVVRREETHHRNMQTPHHFALMEKEFITFWYDVLAIGI